MSMPPISERRSPNCSWMRSRSMPALTSMTWQAVDARFHHPRQQRLDEAAGVHDDGQASRGRGRWFCVWAGWISAVHAQGHEGPLFEAHVLVVPDAIGLPSSAKRIFHELDGEVGVGLDHVPDPVRIIEHAHQHVLDGRRRVDQLKDVDARPAERSSLASRHGLGLAIGFEVDAAAVGEEEVAPPAPPIRWPA